MPNKQTLPPGCIQLRRSRRDGTLVGVYNARRAGLWDGDGLLPWATVCEDHGQICNHTTRALARHHSPHPSSWCSECQEADET